MDRDEGYEKAAICEHCGNIVETSDLQEGTMTCFWCWKALQTVFPFTKPFRRTKVALNDDSSTANHKS